MQDYAWHLCRGVGVFCPSRVHSQRNQGLASKGSSLLLDGHCTPLSRQANRVINSELPVIVPWEADRLANPRVWQSRVSFLQSSNVRSCWPDLVDKAPSVFALGWSRKEGEERGPVIVGAK